MAKTATKTAPKAAPEPKAAPAKQSAKPLPNGMRSVTPHLVVAGAFDAIAWYEKAFGAQKLMAMPGPDGKLMHGCIRIGDSNVMLVDEFPNFGSIGPKTLKGTPVTIHLFVDDVDSFVAKAVEDGAKVIMPIWDAFWGDRYGVIEDPFGHKWSVATHVHDYTPEQIQENMKKSMGDGPTCA